MLYKSIINQQHFSYLVPISLVDEQINRYPYFFSFLEILPRTVLNELELSSYQAGWITRYQVHIKCRGVLAAKGFIVKLTHN